MNLKHYIKDIPDFPKPGIIFKDISPLLASAKAFAHVINQICQRYQNNKPDKIVGLDARGFIFAAAAAHHLGVGLVMTRKPSKLPDQTISQSYDLEYGQNTFEIHADAISSNDKVLVVDDLLATGGSAEAVCKLINKLGGEIMGIECVVELDFLQGREKLKDYVVNSQILY